MSLAIGVDVGGTSLRAGLVDEHGCVMRAARRRIEGRDPPSFLEELRALVAELGDGTVKLPMAVGLAALTEINSGTVVVAPNLGWRDVPMGPMLSEAFGRRVRLVNDLDAITVGEAACGAGQGAANVVCLFVGTGVGMGAVVHGRVLEGHGGMATELGHVKVRSVETGRACGCGERGCLEAYASGRHLPELLAAKVSSGVRSRLLDEVGEDRALLTADRIEAAAGAGDPAAVELWKDVALELGRAAGMVVTLFNPSVLVLGGGVLLAAPSLQQGVVDNMRRHSGRPQLEQVKLCASQLGDQAGLIGAGLLAHQGL